MRQWQVDLQGKQALVTGASSGIGLVAAMTLASMGASVTLLCRSEQKGRACVEQIQHAVGHDRVSLIVADLAEQAQVRRAAAEFLARGEPLHILLNNAGITNTRRQLTVDGIEETLAVNHLGPFLLTNLLLDCLQRSAPARIVTVASNAHHFVRGMQFDDLQFVDNYRTFKVYGQSKLANLLFSLALQCRLEGSGVTVNSVHPGAVATGLGAQNGLLGKFIPMIVAPFFRSPERGAESSIYACVEPQLERVSGQYYYNCRRHRPKPWAQDSDAAEQLWRVSEALVGGVGTA